MHFQPLHHAALLTVAMIAMSNTGFCAGTTANQQPSPEKMQLITLDPGHFHAALIQKFMYDEIDPTVKVYAPGGPDLNAHLNLIKKYNSRPENPTRWNEKVYTGNDYLEKMLQENKTGLVVIAGNNKKKTAYIKKAVDAGLNVLADKPMAITTSDFSTLRQAFADAERNKVILYDIMTSRFEVTNIIQKALTQQPAIFGKMAKGSAADPAVTIVREHFFLKYVSGAPLVRPIWYFDVDQEGRGLVDVTTHLVDLVQWECFPESSFDYKKDIRMYGAKRWPTAISAAQFAQVAGSDTFPAFLKKDVKDNTLYVDANGEMHYSVKGLHAKITMIWKVQAPDGGGDNHYCKIRGTRANLVIRQGKEQEYKPALYIERTDSKDTGLTADLILANMKSILEEYPGITLKETTDGWQVMIPEKYALGHEQNFQEVTKKYLTYLKAGKAPAWETSAMIAKYYTTTQALEKSLKH